jgi:hypothetical protein
MNLLMTAPLLDSRGTIRYFIGAQIDVSGLVKDGTDLEAFQHMRVQADNGEAQSEQKDEFRELSEMFNNSELDIVRKHGGNMHREHVDAQDDAGAIHMRPRLLIQDQGEFEGADRERMAANPKVDGRLSGPYKHVSYHHDLIPTIALTLPQVPTPPPRALAPHPLLLAFPARPRHSAILLPRPHWWQHARARLRRQRARRRHARCHRQDSMAFACDP